MSTRLQSFILGCILACSLSAIAAAADSPAGVLERAGIQPTAEGVRQYLESLVKEAPAADVDRLIADLGHDKFEVREEASRALESLGQSAVGKLQAATKSPDAEVALRAKTILKRLREPAGSPLIAALALVAEKKLDVGLPLLVKIQAKAADAPTQEAALQAMLAIVQESDRSAATALAAQANPVLKNAGRRLLARLDKPATPVPLDGTFEAVQVKPGSSAGGGPNLICGWELKAAKNLTVTHLAILDLGGDGLGAAHEVAIWDVDDPSAPVAIETIAAGQAAPLAGLFRVVAIKPATLQAGRRYAIVAHYPDTTDMTVDMNNPDGLTLDYAPHIEPLGRRYAFPHQAMAFPGNLTEGAKHCSIGPSFRYEVSGEPARK